MEPQALSERAWKMSARVVVKVPEDRRVKGSEVHTELVGAAGVRARRD